MVKHWCLNGVMEDTDKYSSPVPLIGLYTAAATLVCVLLIISDMWSGFRRKKSWLPCRFFSLNSVTLTLISVSTKLPIDLTSPMPSSQDQLSKLTGTVFICMCMVFLMPSTGNGRKFECFSNMVALSIFVVTVVVNMCIQMATGVIFAFIIEHVIILFFMLVLIVLLWISAFLATDYKETSSDRARKIVKRGGVIEESLLQRVKACYSHGYHSNPQFFLCTIMLCGSVSLISTMCLVVLAEALLRSLAFKDLKFCRGVSAYGWSMLIVVATQVLAVLVVSYASGCRWLTYANTFNLAGELKVRPNPYLEVAYPFYMPKWLYLFFSNVYNFFANPCANWVIKLVQYMSWVLGMMKRTRCMSKRQVARSTENFNEWTLRKSVEDMERWMKMNRSKSPEHVRTLLSTTAPSQPPLTRDLKRKYDLNADVSCLSIIILVDLARVSLPVSLSASLVDVLGEVFEVTNFISKKVSVGSFNSKLKSMTAKILWKGKTGSSFVIDQRKLKNLTDEVVQHESDVDRAVRIIRSFHCSFINYVVRDEAHAVVEFICRRPYASLDELFEQISLLFVDMLHVLLSQFPGAIFSHIVDSPVEEYEERLGSALKFICELESVESYVGWSFPVGSNITSLINSQVSSTADPQSSMPVEVNIVSSLPDVIENVGEIQVLRQDDNV